MKRLLDNKKEMKELNNFNLKPTFIGSFRLINSECQ